jgi:quinol monooxygenase YgiN
MPQDASPRRLYTSVIPKKEGPVNTILARFRILPGKEEEADEAIKAMAAAVEEKEGGALAYLFYQNRKDPNEITVYEIYKDDGAFQAHGGTEHMGAFRAYFGSVFDPATVKIDRLERIAGFSR